MINKVLLILLIVGSLGLFYHFEGHDFLNFNYLKSQLDLLQLEFQQQPLEVILFFCLSFLFLTSLAIPGSLVLTIISGAIFGTSLGLVLVLTMGTLGATLSFLMSRYLFRNFVDRKFIHQFEKINGRLEREGLLYLFTLRLLPASPFVVINLVLGVTSLRAWTFIWTTFLGLIPGDIIYVYAGRQMSQIESPAEILTIGLIITLCLLGILPFATKKMVQWWRRKLTHVQ